MDRMLNTIGLIFKIIVTVIIIRLLAYMLGYKEYVYLVDDVIDIAMNLVKETGDFFLRLIKKN